MMILAVSGSLRASSSNTTLLRAAALVAPAGIEISIYERLGDLPHFNPDLDDENVAEAVTDWRARLTAADAVVFSVPEYAHGVPGVLKNSLDWVVGSGELVDKAVALFNASPRGTYAQASLAETLSAMTARIVAGVTLQIIGISAEQIAADTGMVAQLQSGILVLAASAGRG